MRKTAIYKIGVNCMNCGYKKEQKDSHYCNECKHKLLKEKVLQE